MIWQDYEIMTSTWSRVLQRDRANVSAANRSPARWGISRHSQHGFA